MLALNQAADRALSEAVEMMDRLPIVFLIELKDSGEVADLITVRGFKSEESKEILTWLIDNLTDLDYWDE